MEDGQFRSHSSANKNENDQLSVPLFSDGNTSLPDRRRFFQRIVFASLNGTQINVNDCNTTLCLFSVGFAGTDKDKVRECVSFILCF